MNRKKKITVIIISILIILILVLAISFAFFSTQLNGTDQIVKVGTLDLVLDETSEGISLDNAIGLSDDKGMSLTPSTFKLINNGNKAVDYTIYLDDNTIGETDIRIDDKYLKYNLNKNATDSGATLLTSIGTSPNRVLDSGTIEGGGTNNYSLNLWITDEVDGNYSGQVFSGKLRVEVSQARPLAVETLLAKVNAEDLDYNSATSEQKKEMWTFSHPATEQTEALTDYRYIGANPNNYVMFNDELWRIIGVFTVDDGKGNMEQRVKIIKNDYIYGRFDLNDNSDWATSTLSANLNSGDYWNDGLTNDAKSMLENALWYLGDTKSYQDDIEGMTNYIYLNERGHTVYSDRGISWIGKVGLMYSSDYGYATSGGLETDRNTCLNIKLSNWKSASNCYQNNWIYNLIGEHVPTTVTINHLDSQPFVVLGIYSDGSFTGIHAFNGVEVRPTVYLKSTIKIIDGDGSSSNPYIIAL